MLEREYSDLECDPLLAVFSPHTDTFTGLHLLTRPLH